MEMRESEHAELRKQACQMFWVGGSNLRQDLLVVLYSMTTSMTRCVSLCHLEGTSGQDFDYQI